MKHYRVTVYRGNVKTLCKTLFASSQEVALATVDKLSDGEQVSIDDITVTTDVTGVSLPKRKSK